MSNIARWLDQQPPSIEETVITLHDALLNYIQMLSDLRDDSLQEGDKKNALLIGVEIANCKAFLRGLDDWGLCPDLLGLMKDKP